MTEIDIHRTQMSHPLVECGEAESQETRVDDEMMMEGATMIDRDDTDQGHGELHPTGTRTVDGVGIDQGQGIIRQKGGIEIGVLDHLVM